MRKKLFSLRDVALNKHLIPDFEFDYFIRLPNYSYRHSDAFFSEDGLVKPVRIGKEYVHDIRLNPDDIVICYYKVKRTTKTKTYTPMKDRVSFLEKMFETKNQGLAYNLAYKFGVKI